MSVRRSVGYMPDNFGVYDGMKVWEFLDFFAGGYRIPGVDTFGHYSNLGAETGAIPRPDYSGEWIFASASRNQPS